MEKEEVIRILEEIENLLKLEKFEEITKYIESKRAYIKNLETDSAGRYVDNLIKSLE